MLKNNVEKPLARLRTTITGKPVDWRKRKKILSLEFRSGTRYNKPFDDTMSELRLLRNIFLCLLKKQLPKRILHGFGYFFYHDFVHSNNFFLVAVFHNTTAQVEINLNTSFENSILFAVEVTTLKIYIYFIFKPVFIAIPVPIQSVMNRTIL